MFFSLDSESGHLADSLSKSKRIYSQRSLSLNWALQSTVFDVTSILNFCEK